MKYEELLNFAKNNITIENAENIFEADCKIIIYLLENCDITISGNNRFFVSVNCDGIQARIFRQRTSAFKEEIRNKGLNIGTESSAFTGDYDFSHTNTEWEYIVNYGLAGIRNRILKYREINSDDAKKQRFYNHILSVYDTAFRFMKRAAKIAEAHGKYEMANGIIHLTEAEPSNMFEAMQTTIIYYTLQHMFEGTNLRTLGRLDKLFYQYYKKENKADAECLIMDYLAEIDTLKAPSNIPFAIGGTDEYGNCRINELSYLILDCYKKSKTINTKFHLLCSENMPQDIIEIAFRGVRDGHNSIVFMSDEKIIEALKKMKAEHSDAVNYHIVGCYECGSEGELTCSCNARVNLAKALELTLNSGIDMLTEKQVGLEFNDNFESFDDLFTAYKKQLVYLSQKAMEVTDICESHYKEVHSAPFLSGTYLTALEKGGDLYCEYTGKYNNSSLNAIGLATAVDSLAAIRKLVYEDKTLSLRQFTDILKSDWSNNEHLRLLIKNKFPKYGLGMKKVDSLAKEIVDTLYDTIGNKPNIKGGIWRLGLFSIDWRWSFGEKTAATADGRKSGETLSQNASAAFGADKDGATAHLLSVTAIDASKTPNGTIADIDLHISSVSGENGIQTLTATLKTFFRLGGFGVHYNILNTDVLKDARNNPDKYPNLQVRLCGWNVLFSSLSDKEKDEFIARSCK